MDLPKAMVDRGGWQQRDRQTDTNTRTEKEREREGVLSSPYCPNVLIRFDYEDSIPEGIT